MEMNRQAKFFVSPFDSPNLRMQQQLVDAESFSIGGINAKQSTNCWTIFTTEVSTEGLSYGYCC